MIASWHLARRGVQPFYLDLLMGEALLWGLEPVAIAVYTTALIVEAVGMVYFI